MNELTIKKTDELKRIENELNKCIEWANAHEIIDLKTKQAASDHLKYLKDDSKKLSEKRLEITKPYRDEVDLFNKAIAPLEELAKVAIKTLDGKLISYVKEQERIAREEAEAAKAIEIARLEEESKLAQQAILDSAESSGDNTIIEAAIVNEQIAKQRIDQLQHQKIEVKTMPARGAISLTSVKENWKGEITNKAEALAWILKTERFELIEFNQTALNNLAKSMKKEGEGNGIKVFCEYSTITR